MAIRIKLPRPLRVTRVTYLSVVVYALLLVGFLYYAQDTLRLSFQPAEVEHTVTAQDQFDLKSLSEALMAPVRNHLCPATIHPQRALRYQRLLAHWQNPQSTLFSTANHYSRMEDGFPPAPFDESTTDGTATPNSRNPFRGAGRGPSSTGASRPPPTPSTSLPVRPLNNTLMDADRIHNQRFFVAINLHNNEAIIPDFLVQLLPVLQFIGRRNLFVSIFESGSRDQTKTYLRFLELFLSTWKIPFLIRVSSETRGYFDHRIAYLARVRNEALKPLLTHRQTIGQFQRILFLNDVLFCTDDIKEMIYQSYLQQTDMTCALDYDKDIPAEKIKEGQEDLPPRELGFYDTWVARDVYGKSFSKRPMEHFVPDEEAAKRMQDGLSFQASCCWEFSHQVDIDWNNTIVSDELSEYHRQNPDGPIYDRCSSSEINVLCRDFHRHGFDRVLIVSKAKVAYEFEAYHDLKTKYHGQMERWDPREDTILLFRPPPEAVECRPMDGTVQRDPNGPAGLELFDDGHH